MKDRQSITRRPLPPGRTRLRLLAALLGAPVLRAIGASGKDEGEMQPQRVQITAQRFHYTPSEITLKVGVPVLLEISSLDFVHGFNLPGMNLRADLPPGKLTTLRFTPTQPGVLPFLCDNFCGDGHEEMSGRFIVQA